MIEQLSSDSQGKLVVFGAKQIRRVWVDEQWYFSIVDIVAALTDSDNPRDYWYRMKRREQESSGIELSTLCRQLKLTAADGKSYKTEAVNTEAAFRIIQSIPSPKAEPFKRWLAQVGYERVQEIENPELAQQRMRQLFKEKGYPDDWIEKRVRGIAVRDELTGEWQKRGIAEQQDFAILTSEISKATFGVTPSGYKKLKGLKRENLRDHMTDLELIFTMLGEAATTEIARNKDAQGFTENQRAARDGGTVAGDARRQLEAKSGKKVITSKNYLTDKPKPKLPPKSE
ncbi:MAG: phage antirepressor protein [Deltaproteobacteria bacterium CG_4_10_14_3_um_filter_60_8]|nr:MAG: phage antirepressor protein [Desulfobacterales bacterium CG2_30_60_27]PIY23704.1 MAG: phage antirepressor protein [Deltaproteobacteria bacterium CG_4_10_14_3_um_filter_60_8]